MRHIKVFEDFLNELKSNEIEDIIAKLKKYTAMGGELDIDLYKLFKNIDIKKAKKEHPEIFDLPSKYKKPNIYFFRGTARPISFLKSLGEPDEIISGDFVLSLSNSYGGDRNPKLLSWNDRKFKSTGEIQSWSMFLNTAQGFADSTSIWNLPPYEIDEKIPIILMLNYNQNKNDIFMNPDWMTSISTSVAKEEGEVFHKGKVATVDIAVYIDKTIGGIYKDWIKENS